MKSILDLNNQPDSLPLPKTPKQRGHRGTYRLRQDLHTGALEGANQNNWWIKNGATVWYHDEDVTNIIGDFMGVHGDLMGLNGDLMRYNDVNHGKHMDYPLVN